MNGGGAALLWDALLSLGWHLELHTDRGRLPEVLEQLPDAMPLVIDYMGKPEAISANDKTVRTLGARARHGKVYIMPIRLAPKDTTHSVYVLGWMAE